MNAGTRGGRAQSMPLISWTWLGSMLLVLVLMLRGQSVWRSV